MLLLENSNAITYIQDQISDRSFLFLSLTDLQLLDHILKVCRVFFFKMMSMSHNSIYVMCMGVISQ